MAQKRMFDKKVVGSDKFLDLPNSSKALYFMAGMEADDKGFFQPRKLQKMCGFSDDDYKILIAKRFFITFDSGVMVVTDWNKNNWLDSRRITETEYTDELNLLKLVNQKYEFRIENDTAKPLLSEYSIEENSIDKNSIEKKEIYKERKFKKPTLIEVEEYCKERNNEVDPQKFIDFYESKGWLVGKSPMKDWKACIRTWEQRSAARSTPKWFNEDSQTQELSKEDLEEMERILNVE
jgi:hypothetical protein